MDADRCAHCDAALHGWEDTYCLDCALRPRRSEVRRWFHQDRTWRAYALLNEWGDRIADDERGDWARRVRGVCLLQLSYQLEDRMRRTVEGVTA